MKNGGFMGDSDGGKCKKIETQLKLKVTFRQNIKFKGCVKLC